MSYVTVGNFILIKCQNENPIHISNIMMADPKTGKSTRIGHEINKNGNNFTTSSNASNKKSMIFSFLFSIFRRKSIIL